MSSSEAATENTLTVNGVLDIEWVRDHFPALQQTFNGHPVAYFDGPGGTQVPRSVIDAITDYLTRSNANLGGSYVNSHRTEAVIQHARLAMADLLGCDKDEVVLGPNMTTLTLAMSRAIGRELKPDDEIVVSCLDHDANVAPWRALEERGVILRMVGMRVEDCTLDLDDLAAKINARTKVVAIGYSSNLVGTVNDVAHAVKLAHAVGALAYVDAVHYVPHHMVDVRALDCDFLACSSYKFFGPHMGVLYGKREHLHRLRPYKLRASSDAVPDRWNTGTLNHECAAAIPACVDYLASLGQHADSSAAGQLDSETPVTARRAALAAAYAVIHSYEHALLNQLVDGLRSIPGMTIYGVPPSANLATRSPTCAISIEGVSAHAIASYLGTQGVFVGNGHFYALHLAEALGTAESGVVRIGITHYNTAQEIERLLAGLRQIASPSA